MLVCTAPDPRLLSAFRSKFDIVPSVLADWTAPIGGIKNKRVLDFGCGEGTSALGVALKHEPLLVVGTDINREYEQLATLARAAEGIADLPDNLIFEEIKRGEVSAETDFDLIYSWSVFEHIDQNLFSEVVTNLRAKLRDGGHMFVQIAPLYYSPEGSHLWDIGFSKWEHLTQQIDHIYYSLQSKLEKVHADSLWSMFITLNKITAPKLITDISRQGFEIVREYKTTVTLDPLEHLLLAYSREALITDQVVALFRKR
jgi:SAM-dependent methyltransferase